MQELAPIAIFAFRRARHLSETLDALEKCPEFHSSEVIVYSDGPRNRADEQDVLEVRQMLEARRTPNMSIVARERNNGLANSIIGAVSELTERHGRVIVIEDDIVLQPSGLTWLNRGLREFEAHDRAMQISAYQYRIPEFEGRTTGTFQRFATTWGWATWRRAWSRFDASAKNWELVNFDPAVRHAFDAEGVYPFSDMLLKQMSGKIDSWGIRWSWSVFRNQGLTLMPPKSLVTNTGLDGSGTHNTLGPLKRFVTAPKPYAWTADHAPGFPDAVEVVENEERAFRRALKNTHALRNHNIKKALAALGLKRFSVL